MNTLNTYIEKAIKNWPSVSEERKKLLEDFADFIRGETKSHKKCDLIFICTHNSRRSHLSQAWGQIASAHFKVQNITCYSGGTEATAFFPSAVKALEGAGVKIEVLSEDKNPVYALKYADDAHPIVCFSKKYSASFNPQKRFGAVMTCAHADDNCPYIPEASIRIPIRYEDPKVADGTPEQQAKYDERCFQIATEMLYAFSKV